MYIFCISGSVVSLLDIQGPLFRIEPPYRFEFSNESGGRLDCAAQGSPTPKIEWLIDNTVIAYVKDLRIALSNGSLMFPPFPETGFRPDVHSTVYRCRASNEAGVILSRFVHVKAVVKQKYEINVNYEHNVILGNTAVLRCQIPSYMSEYIIVTSWIQDDVNIYLNTDTGGKYVVLSSGDLYVFNATPNDGYKSYRCRTVNKITGESQASVFQTRLSITEPLGREKPKVSIEKYMKLTVKLGDDVILPCVAQGHPLPTYSWYREIREDRTNLKSLDLTNPRYKILVDNAGLLKISNVRLEDEGKYLCWINNTVGEDTIQITLSITSPLSIQITPQLETIDLGKDVSIHCKVSGFPVSSQSLLYHNGQMLNSNANRLKINLTDERLLIRNVAKEDKGMYQCFISNEYDMVQATCEIQLGDASPELIYKFTDQTLQPGPALSLKCEATGNPPPQFVWTLDGFSIPENTRFVVGQYVTIHDDVISHLNISSIKDEDGGEFTCTARNSIASVSHSARINVYGNPYIRPMSKVIAVAGKDLTIKCPVGGYPIETITWEKEGKLLPLDMRHKVFPNGVLRIQNVNKLTDSGTYLCQAKNHEKQFHRRDVQVYVSTPPKILPMPSALAGILREGQRVALTCQILEGDLPLSFEWKKDGKLIQGVSSYGNIQGGSSVGSSIVIRRVDEFTSSLVIEKIHSVHSGNYTCLVNNNAGQDEASVQLTVNVPPRWTFEPLDQNIKAGYDITLHCQAEGYPKPSITWKKAMGVEATEYKDFSYESNVRQHGNGSLEFRSVAKLNQGHYLCEAKNNIGSGISKVVFLKVNSPPHFPQKTKHVTVQKGEKAHLLCKAEGDNPLEIRWKNEGQRISEDVDSRYTIREQVLEDGMISELGIANVLRQDSGTLSCLATNYHGTAEMTIQLLVQETPEAPKNIRIAEESSRSLQISWTAPYSGNTAITQYIIQYKSSEEMWPTQPLKIIVPGSQTSATLQPLLPATQYQVRLLAENPLGMSETGAELQASTLEEAPNGAPREVTSDPGVVDPTELLIKWKAPPRESWNGVLLGYDVGYQISSGSSLALSSYTLKSVELDNQYEGELRIPGLTPYTKYAIVVRGYNSVGKGPFSEPFIARTNEGVPSLPPENIACSSVTSTTLKITWETVPNEARNGIIQGYKVVYYPAEDWYESLESDTKVTSSLSASLQGLGKFTNYSIQVMAFTQAGDGTLSDVIFCRTLEDVPAAPAHIKAALVSPSRITITWLPPSPSNGPLVSYSLYSRILGPGPNSASGEAGGPHKKVLRPTSVEYFVDVRGGVEGGASYQFWVAAATAVGEGPHSRVVAVFPSKKVPAKIVSFSQTIVTPYKLNVSLDCKHVGNPLGTLSWYVNEKPLALDTVGMRLQLKDHGGLVIKEIQYSDQKNYTCKVENNHGSDEITYSVIVRVPPEPPELIVVAQELDALHLKWTDRVESSIPILGYTINYKRDHGDWEEVHIPRIQGRVQNTNTYLLENLWCGTSYQLYITAHNRIGTGLPCDIVHTRTKGTVPIAPSVHQILTYNSSAVSIWLDAWGDGGCPMLYHVIEYKQHGVALPWQPPRTVQPSERVYTIGNLAPGTAYQIRATAHNNIGATALVYNFTTLTLEGGTIPPNQFDPELPSHSSWLSFSSLFLFFSLLLIGLPSLYVFYLYCHKQHKQHRGDILAESASIAQLQNQHNRDQQYGSGRGSHSHPMEPGATFKSDSTGYIEDICPYATFQLSKSPASISSPYEESTYSGNVYSGPYHSVRGTFVYHQPKTPSVDYKLRHVREPEYTKVRRQGGKLRDPHSESQESDNPGSTDSEVKKILTLHLPISEYDDQGSEDSDGGGRRHGKPQGGGGQEMVSFRHRIPSREVSKESSSSSEDSLVTSAPRKPLPPPTRKTKSKTPTQLLMGGKRVVKSSSGYSSHTEETTFSFSDRLMHPPPPSRFSDRSSISRDLLSDSSDLTKRRPSRGSNRGGPNSRDTNTFQIDV
ncbi:hypothetical protein M8J75_013991 [Diaphorina citri]|nr:hypothetical protein M8J75_013991 [Diaphorina citri]